MVSFLLIALLSAKLVDSCLPCLGRSAWRLVPLAFAATGSETRGPNLAVVIMRPGADPRPLAVAGQILTISVGVNNLRGDGDAHSSVLTVKLPPGLKFQSASSAPDSVEGGSSLVWKLGTIPAAALPLTFDMNLAVAADVPPATKLTVSANVATSDPDKYLEDNTDSIIIVVEPAAADLGVGSNLEAVPLTIGGPVKFTAEVSNQGTTVASASVLVLTLPPKVAFKSGDPAPTATSGDTVTWQLGDIAPGASRTVAVTIALDTSLAATASDPASENPLKFKFDATTTTTQLNPANDHLEIEKHVERAGSDLKVWLSVQGTDNPDELPVGKDVTYTITYGNFGNAPAQHASISLSLAQGLNLVHAEPPPAAISKNDRFAGGVLSWNAGDLGVGQSDIIKSQVHVTSVPEDGSLVMATISAPGPSVNSGDNVAYSLRQAPRTAGQHGAAAQSGHLFRWLSLLAVLLIVILWAAFRARRRPASA
jgi:uncharacterized repeat protein (TIGR01451 family)